MEFGNIFVDLPTPGADEVFEDLVRAEGFAIERIVSVRPSLPADQWYDQKQAEWVLLLRGSAGLLFDGRDEEIVMHPGDYVRIPARCRHKVVWTDPHQATLWLAVHYTEPPSVTPR
jgi:cupin 2 domain-containing protein